MREPPEAPAEFVSYIDRRLPALESAAIRLTGDEVQADRLARELLTLVALRWPRLIRADAKQDLPTGASADVYLSKLFQLEADDFGYPRMILNLDGPGPMRRRSALSGTRAAHDEAAYIWQTARQKLRRRLLIAGAVGGVVAIAAVCRRGGSKPQAQPQQPPLFGATGLPEGALVVAAGPFELGSVPEIPAELALPESTPPALTQNPLPRITFLAGSPQLDGGRLYAYAGGQWRHVDFAPERAGAWLTPTSLSPDGKQAVLVTPAGTVLLDLVSGQSSQIPATQPASPPVWLSEHQLLLAEDALFDPASGAVLPVPAGPEDAVTPRRRETADRATTLTELLPAGRPLTAPNRVRRWTLGDDEPQPVTISANGPLAGLLGRWHGPAFGSGADRVVRLCRPGALPSEVTADVLVAVASPETAEILRVLLIDTVALGTPALLGWQDERTVLLAFSESSDGYLRIVAWDHSSDRISRVCRLNSPVTVALRDLTRVS